MRKTGSAIRGNKSGPDRAANTEDMSKRDRESVFQAQVGGNSIRNWNFDL